MNLLLDTHVFLWFIAAEPRLPTSFSTAIREPSIEIYLSAAAICEAVIKHGLGKLPLPELPAAYLPRQREAHGITALPIDEGVMSYVARLPLLHRDTFDRIVIAQALQYGLTVVTVDSAIAAYPVPFLTPDS